MHFKKLTIAEWQQFAKIEVIFHERLTILTGANGSGKTTILNLLAKHQGWDMPSFMTPRKEKQTGIIRFFSRLFSGEDKSDFPNFGKLEYSNGALAILSVQPGQAPSYQVQMKNKQGVDCFFIPAHRPVYRYQPATQIPGSKKEKRTVFDEANNLSRTRFLGGREDYSNSFIMKNALIGWAIQGYGVYDEGEAIMPRDEEQARIYKGFQEILRKILPKSLGFERFSIRKMEVVFVCNQGKDEFMLETASGGVCALIDIAWLIYMYSTGESQECTVIIDEIENHLHPTMQRHVLPDLMSVFPNITFIVSTHSPLVVGSVKDSFIYALIYDEGRKVISRLLDFRKEARTASEILDNVLGVSVTIPPWAEEELGSIVEKYKKKPEDEVDLAAMRTDLSNAGLERLMPSAIESVVEPDDD